MKSFFVVRHDSASISMMVCLSACLAMFMLLLFLPAGLNAQGLSGITGTATDQSGGVVPDAKVTVTNDATNVVHTAVTTSQGTYFITDLVPGAYTVRIEKDGFRTEVLHAVNVFVSQTATADATLSAGTTTTTVEVTAPSITLQTDEPNLGTVIQSTILEEVPTFIGGGRDRQIDSYLFLAPGVTGSSFSHRINGGIDFQNEVMFNGVVIAQAETQGFQTIYNPPYELVNEPDIITSNFSAKYGFADGVASYRLKSGVNQLHGDAFEINRNSYFDAPGVNPQGTTMAIAFRNSEHFMGEKRQTAARPRATVSAKRVRSARSRKTVRSLTFKISARSSARMPGRAVAIERMTRSRCKRPARFTLLNVALPTWVCNSTTLPTTGARRRGDEAYVSVRDGTGKS